MNFIIVITRLMEESNPQHTASGTIELTSDKSIKENQISVMMEVLDTSRECKLNWKREIVG